MWPSRTSTARCRRSRRRIGQAKAQALRERVAADPSGLRGVPGRGVRRRAQLAGAAARAGRRGDRRLRPGAREGRDGGLGAAHARCFRDRRRGGRQATRRMRSRSTTSRGDARPAARIDAPAPAQAARRARAADAIGVRCVYSRESVALPPQACAAGDVDGNLNCHGYGSSVAVTATFGMVAAGEVLRRLRDRRSCRPDIMRGSTGC